MPEFQFPHTNIRRDMIHTPSPRSRIIMMVTPAQAQFLKEASKRRDVTVSEYMRSVIDTLQRVETKRSQKANE